MLVNGSDRFGQVSVHLIVPDIEIEVVVVYDPWKNRIL